MELEYELASVLGLGSVGEGKWTDDICGVWKMQIFHASSWN